jgi:transposase
MIRIYMDILKCFSVLLCGMVLTNKQLRKTLDEIEWLKKYYNKHFAVEKKPFTGEYDKKLRTEMRAVVERINTDVDKAAEPITLVDGKPGRPPKDRILLTKLHLFQVFFEFTNREMECFSLMFLLNGEEAFSYKTIERAYSDPIVAMILHNLFVLSAGEPRKVDSSADGTGIGLLISKHYRKDREQDIKEEKDSSKRKEYLFTVAILDLDTNLYIGYAAGFKSEKELFKEALDMARKAGFEFDSMRLDKYYAYQSIFRCVGRQTKVIVIPKKNATIRGPKEWKQLITRLITAPFAFLAEYFKRVHSEYNFSKDKRRFGTIRQRLAERIITAAFSRATLHNYSAKHMNG